MDMMFTEYLDKCHFHGLILAFQIIILFSFPSIFSFFSSPFLVLSLHFASSQSNPIYPLQNSPKKQLLLQFTPYKKHKNCFLKFSSDTLFLLSWLWHSSTPLAQKPIFPLPNPHFYLGASMVTATVLLHCLREPNMLVFLALLLQSKQLSCCFHPSC